jgi:hypothetical protein
MEDGEHTHVPTPTALDPASTTKNRFRPMKGQLFRSQTIFMAEPL